MVTFSAIEHHRPLAAAKLYCLVIEPQMCEQQHCIRLLYCDGEVKPEIHKSQV